MGKRKSPRSGPFLGKDKTFPAGNKTHQREAIGGATRSFNAGNISKGTEDRIQTKARKMLTAGKGAKARTGKSKSWLGP